MENINMTDCIASAHILYVGSFTRFVPSFFSFSFNILARQKIWKVNNELVMIIELQYLLVLVSQKQTIANDKSASFTVLIIYDLCFYESVSFWGKLHLCLLFLTQVLYVMYPW